MRAPEIAFFVLGTTIATNCLLERKGQRTLYLTTAGFEDVPFIQRIDRKSLFDLQWQKSIPYVRRSDCLGVAERVAQDGEVRIELDDSEIERLVGEVRARDAAEGGVSVAINLLFSYLRPVHEQRLAEALRDALPSVAVSFARGGSDLARVRARQHGHRRRLHPPTHGTLPERLDEGLARAGLRCRASCSSPTVVRPLSGRASRQAVSFVLSGLAGGLIAGSTSPEASGCTNVITLDMGGTSADVGVVVEGAIRTAASSSSEWSLPIAVPVVDLTTIGAGGGSVGRLRSGAARGWPEGAGANPGPAACRNGYRCHGHRRRTSCSGRLNPDYFLGARFRSTWSSHVVPWRDRCAARVRGRRGSPRDRRRRVREHGKRSAASVRRPRPRLPPLRHEWRSAAQASPRRRAQRARSALERVLVPPSPGVASAFGAQAADLRVDRRLTRVLRSDPRLTRSYGTRCRTHRLRGARRAARGGRVTAPTDPRRDCERALLVRTSSGGRGPLDARRPRRVAGRALPSSARGYLRVSAPRGGRRLVHLNTPRSSGASPPVRPHSRRAWRSRSACDRSLSEAGRWVDTPIYRRPAVGAIKSSRGGCRRRSTRRSSSRARSPAHVSGAMFIEHQAGRADRALRAQGFPVLDLVWLQILHAQLVNICEEMGLAMMRTSYSPIFSEGLDFCCLILDRDGELVAMQNLNPAMMGRALYSDAG